LKVVLDASAAVEVALDGKHAERLSELIAEASVRLAPEMLLPEVANALWKYHQFERLQEIACLRALAFAAGLVDSLVSNSSLAREALSMGIAAKTPIYDMFYLALAQREDATLLTLDAKLRKAAVRQGVRVS
jgi:predicted nucleic acid-binding protein